MRHKKITIFILLFGLLVWMYYSMNPAAQNSLFPSCPTYSILGIYCPGCGSQRAIHYILHAEFGKAFRYNPLFVVLLPLSLFLAGQYLWEKFTEKRFQVKFLENKFILYSFFFLLIAYFIGRNLPFDFLNFLKPPNYAL